MRDAFVVTHAFDVGGIFDLGPFILSNAQEIVLVLSVDDDDLDGVTAKDVTDLLGQK